MQLIYIKMGITRAIRPLCSKNDDMRKIKTSTKKRLGAALQAGGIGLGRWPPRDPVQNGLFNDQSVSADDLRAWLAAVPGLDPDSPRAAQYVESYRVADKIRKAKADGLFESIVRPCRGDVLRAGASGLCRAARARDTEPGGTE